MTMQLSRSNLDSRLWISWGICFNTSSPWGCTGPPVVKARYNIIFKSLSTKSPSQRLTPIITVHTIPRNMDTWVMRSNPLMRLKHKWSKLCDKHFCPCCHNEELTCIILYWITERYDINLNRRASKWRRTSMTTVLQVFTTGKSQLIEASTLCQVVTSWFISVIFSGEGMPMRSFVDERMLDSMWLSWASTVFVCWLHSALLDDDSVGRWLKAGLWLIGDDVCSEILECGVSSKSQWTLPLHQW